MECANSHLNEVEAKGTLRFICNSLMSSNVVSSKFAVDMGP